MNNNVWRMFMDIDSRNAKAKLDEIDKLMDKIEAKSDKGASNFFHSSQKDIDEAIASMQRFIEVKKELDEVANKKMGEFGATGNLEGINKAKAGLKSLQDEAQKTQASFTRMANMNASPNNVNRTYIKDQKLFQTELSNTEKALQKLKREYGEVQRTASRVGRATHSATATGRMTHLQAERLRSDFSKTDSFQERRNANEQQRSQLVGQIQKDTARQQQLRERAGLETDPAKKQAYKAEESALYDSIDANRKLVEQIKKVNDGYDRLINDMKTSQATMNSSTVKVDADRNTILGQMQSRAPSIAMASIGAVAGAFGGLYAKGASASQSMRQPSISIGQRTGQADYRPLRREAQAMGVQRSMGYKGMDMLQFQDDVLSNMGYTNKKDLNKTTQALAEGTRAVPVDKETLGSFMNDVMQNGSVKDSAQVKAIQEGFLGAIEQSGMAGREKEQLEALKGLSAQVFTGRNGSNEELKNLMAMQTMLSGTGNRAVQGEAGGQLMTDLSSGIQGGFADAQTRLLFGAGTKFKGRTGMYDLKKQMEEGASPENMRTIMEMAKRTGGGTEKGTKATLISLAQQHLQTDLTTDQADGLYEAFGNNKLSDKEMEKVLKETGVEGKKKYDKNGKEYAKSSDGLRNTSEAITEQKASEIYDNKLTDNIAKVNEKMGQLPAVVYASIIALGAFTASLAASAGMSFGSSLLKEKATTMFSGADDVAKGVGGASAGGGSLLGEVGKAFKTGKSTGGIKGGLKSAFGSAKEVGGLGASSIKDAYASGGLKGAFKEAKGVGSAIFKSGDDVAGGVAKGAKGASKIGGLVSKASTALIALTSIFDIATSDDKGKAVGRNAGGLGGMWAGGKAGALAGSKIHPVYGTIIGGLAGSIGGNMFGEKLGEGFVDMKRNISNKIFGEKATKEQEKKKAKFDAEMKKADDQMFGGIKDIGKSAWQGIKGFFGGETAEASEIDNSVGGKEATEKTRKELAKGATGGKENRAKDKENKDNTNKHMTAEKTRENNNSIESANLSLYAKLLDRAMQILNRARAQNGIFGNGNGNGGGVGDDSSGGELKSGEDFGGDWEKAIRDAAKKSGIDVSDSEVQAILSLIKAESNGDEKANQSSAVDDVNMHNGSGGAKGLLQYIQSTFDSYKTSSSSDIYNGNDQLLAFFNNSNWKADLADWQRRYPTGDTGWGPSGSKTRALGGHITSPEHALLGEVAGQDEYVINPSQPTAPRLLAEATAKTAQKFRLYGNGSGGDWTSQALASGGGGGTTSPNVTLQNTNQITVSVNVKDGTPQDIARQTGDQVASRLDTMASDAMDFYSKELKRK